MGRYVLNLSDIVAGPLPLVGGKAAGLGQLSHIEGIRVPPGFCVTTAAFERMVDVSPGVRAGVERVARLSERDRGSAGHLSAELRAAIEGAAVPSDVEEEIAAHLGALGPGLTCAVRSSATAEDLPTASFAGQHESCLGVVGRAAVLEAVRRCWASLFSERAIVYRLRQGATPTEVQMAVVVQEQVAARAAGTLFTADPVSGLRTVCVVEAVPGLGEALVSGRVDADRYHVREGRVLERVVAPAAPVRTPSAGEGSADGAAAQGAPGPVLTDEQLCELERIGRRVEAHAGHPQDIEWCHDGGAFYLVQSRPITTLFPVPARADGGRYVYVSVGHQQMMTDPLKPLGLSVFQLTAGRPMYEAGGRLFVDPTRELSAPASRAALLGVIGRSDPLIHDALTAVIERGDQLAAAPPVENRGPSPHWMAPPAIDDGPGVIAELTSRAEVLLEEARAGVRGRSGLPLVQFILEDIQRLKQSVLDPGSMAVVLGGINAASWLNDQIAAWLGEQGVADVLSQSAPNNVTAEMGLALLDVADVIRPHPEVQAHLARAGDEDLLEGLLPLAGGPEVHAALSTFLERYGMRCAGEIDLTRPRWVERPTMLVPILLSNVRCFERGEGRRRFERGRQLAEAKEAEIVDRLMQLPDGEIKAAEAQRMIRRLRSFAGYREFPKYMIVRRYLVYKAALMAEAERLVGEGILREAEDIFYLSLPELGEVLERRALDEGRVERRRQDHLRFLRLVPPRVMTSEGEVFTGAYRREGIPPGALVGLAVSPGVVEGRARVLHRMEDADLQEGDILVTTFTDPSWTPVFLTVKALVTEVGGLMTHGAVIAREYGLPAVIGVVDATRLLRDGERIRVHGGAGYVERLG